MRLKVPYYLLLYEYQDLSSFHCNKGVVFNELDILDREKSKEDTEARVNEAEFKLDDRLKAMEGLVGPVQVFTLLENLYFHPIKSIVFIPSTRNLI